MLKHPHNPEKILKSCRIRPGIPVKPQLAKPTESIKVIFKRFEGKKFTCEYKYDGLRGQVHYNNNKVTIYSRNLENMRLGDCRCRHGEEQDPAVPGALHQEAQRRL